MNFKQIEAFLWVSRLGGFSAAAHRLNTTQPAISMRIAELEKDLGVQLFDRHFRSLPLTIKGREFYLYAERIYDLSNEAQNRLKNPSRMTGRIKIGVTESVALTWLSDLVVRLNEEFPNMAIDLDINLTNVIWQKLRSNSLDLAIMPGPVHGKDLTSVHLGSILYTWMASPRFDLGAPDKVFTPEDLKAVPLITLSENSNLNEIVEEWFGRESTTPRRMNVCNSLGVVAAMTMAGLGISMLPPRIFSKQIDQGLLCLLKTEPKIPPLQFFAIQPLRNLSPITEVITDYARQASTFDFHDLPENVLTAHSPRTPGECAR